MKFRRKSTASKPEETPEAAESSPEEEPTRAAGPFDSADVADGEELVDLGSLRLRALADREVRLQVDEESEQVQAVLIVGSEGALEVRAFAAPRNGDLWSQVRPQLAAEAQRSGAQVSEREGPHGVELMCRRPAKSSEGEEGVVPSRVVGVNGDRWMLRATFFGQPAIEPDAEGWDDSLDAVVVHRGTEAMAVGEALPLNLPPQARRVE